MMQASHPPRPPDDSGDKPAGQAQTQPGHHHHPSDASDDATMTHAFDDVDKWVERFDDPAREEWQKPGLVVRSLLLKPGMNAADIGAGTGYFNRHLAEAVGPGGKVYAADLEPKMVAYMGERAKREETPNVVPLLAAADDPELPAGAIDMILIVNTYHHFDDRLAYFGRLKAALKPGGRIAVIDFLKKELPVGPPLEHKLDRDQVVAEMDAAGYDLIREPEFLPYQYFLIFQAR